MSAVTDLTRWLRTDFADSNTSLEEAYFVERAEIVYDVTDLDQRKHALRDDGATLIGRLGTDVSYELLGASASTSPPAAATRSTRRSTPRPRRPCAAWRAR